LNYARANPDALVEFQSCRAWSVSELFNLTQAKAAATNTTLALPANMMTVDRKYVPRSS
jgi:hypothetical protein